jgi:hypothetical protein
MKIKDRCGRREKTHPSKGGAESVAISRACERDDRLTSRAVRNWSERRQAKSRADGISRPSGTDGATSAAVECRCEGSGCCLPEGVR